MAFIKGEFHDGADTIHAYIVFGYPDPGRSSNVPPSLDPFEAVKRAVEGCDGAVYMGRTIRVDRVGSGKGRADGAESITTTMGGAQTDPKRSIFVGNLDFQSKEEDVRAFFETLVKTEHGATAALAAGDADEEGDEQGAALTPAHSFVSHVRIVRDRDTQLGKGFAYVEFTVRQLLR